MQHFTFKLQIFELNQRRKSNVTFQCSIRFVITLRAVNAWGSNFDDRIHLQKYNEIYVQSATHRYLSIVFVRYKYIYSLSATTHKMGVSNKSVNERKLSLSLLYFTKVSWLLLSNQPYRHIRKRLIRSDFVVCLIWLILQFVCESLTK